MAEDHPLKDAFPVIEVSSEPLHNTAAKERNNKGQYLPGFGAIKPGETRNPNGRPVNEDSITYWYKKLLAEGKNAKEIAEAMISKAKAGSLGHSQEVTDRTDGKVVDKHLNLNLTATVNPEVLAQFQSLLIEDKEEETKLLEEYPGK